jgi:hypothetical protein
MALILTNLTLQDRQNYSYLVPSSNTAITGVVVVNPDGSSIGNASDGGVTQYNNGGTVGGTQIGTALVFNNGGTWNVVSQAQPLPVTITSGEITGFSTSANQTNGNQKSQIVDGSGNVIGSTSNALNVNITGGATSGTQYQELAITSPATGTLSLGRYLLSLPTLTNGQMNEPLLDSSSRLFVNVSNGSLAVTGTFYQTTQPVSLASLPALPTGTNTIGSVETTDASGNIANILAPTVTPSGYNAQFVALVPNIPTIVQKTNNISSGSVASLAKAFVNNNLVGNSIVVTCGIGNGTTPTVTDSAGNTYVLMAVKANNTNFNVAVFLATNIKAGANTVTVNNGGTTASIAMEIYELSGLFNYAASQPAQSSSNTGTTTSATMSTFGSASQSNEIIFMCVANGTAAVTITPNGNWSNDSGGALQPTTPSGLYGFASASFVVPAAVNYGTIGFTLGSSEPMAVLAVGLYPITIPTTNQNIGGSVSSASSIGSTFPGTVFPIGFENNSTNLQQVKSATYLGTAAATSDGIIPVADYNYNGTTVDAVRNNINTTTGDTPTLTTTAVSNGATQTNYNARGVTVTAICGTVSGTLPTLVMQTQWSPDGGTTWINYGSPTSAVTLSTGSTVSVQIYPTAQSTGLLGSTGAILNDGPLPRTWRMTYTGGGTSFSIAIASVQVNYMS